MRVFNVLIAQEQYDDDGNELAPKILFGPKLVFGYSKEVAKRKALVESKISVQEIENAELFMNEIFHISPFIGEEEK